MKVTDSVLRDVAHLTNLYPIQSYRLDVLKGKAQTGEFCMMDQ